MIPQHLSKTNEHYTPKHVVETSRTVMGDIDLDPASCVEANETVKAKRAYMLPDDGLELPWRGRVFCNPPGGSLVFNKKAVREAMPEYAKELDETYGDPVQWLKAAREGDAKHIAEGLAEESAKWGTKSRAVAWWRKCCLEYRMGRVEEFVFVGFTLELLRTSQKEGWPDPFDFTFCVPRERMKFGGDSPPHANVIVYGGPSAKEFRETFSEIGRVK